MTYRNAELLPGFQKISRTFSVPLAFVVLFYEYFFCTELCGIDGKISTILETPQRPFTQNTMIYYYLGRVNFGEGLYLAETNTGKMDQRPSVLLYLLGTPTP